MSDVINVLKLTLHGRLVGYLVGHRSGRNVFIVSNEFKEDQNRPTFSLITHPLFPNSKKVMAEPWVKNQRLHPVLSNLLPEGSLRELIAQGLKIHIDNEFHLLSYLGEELPGALIALPVAPEEVPDYILSSHEKAEAVEFGKAKGINKFSLAGVQIKFSMKEKDGRYTLSKTGVLGDWIIKTPSAKHKDVPLNEFSSMSLASLAGVNIPDIKLVELDRLNDLPQINLPDEKFAYAIRRFDREAGDIRIHMEDFAQVLVKYPHEKYVSGNYEQIGRILYQYSGDGLADVQQFARRLLVNILLANGDAHLKNWSLLYSDKVTPRLSPAYDIVSTQVYMTDESELALNMGAGKNWYEVTYGSFERWAVKSGIPWRAIKPHLDDVMERARTLWPQALEKLPMNHEHKIKLKNHWRRLDKDFRI